MTVVEMQKEANRTGLPVFAGFSSSGTASYYYPQWGTMFGGGLYTVAYINELKQKQFFADTTGKTQTVTNNGKTFVLVPHQKPETIISAIIPSIDNQVIDSQEELNAAQAQVNAQTAANNAVTKIVPAGISKVIAGIPKEKMIYVWGAVGLVGVLILLKMRK
jgi:hypothetical protein